MKTRHITNEYYHLYNRGNNKRQTFFDDEDISRFLSSIQLFSQKRVSIVAYCVNDNHYHLILKQTHDAGIEKFMHRLGIGYTMYFNKKYRKSGALFQGKYKAKHVSSNKYLTHLSVYVNLNFKVHTPQSTLRPRSSWEEYIDEISNQFCAKDVVLFQFKGREAYKRYAEDTLECIKKKKERDRG